MKYPLFKKIFLFLFLFTEIQQVDAQKWVEQKYAISTKTDVPYAEVVDFAGNKRTLKLDLSLPTDDQPPVCGRPLLLLIHGGAFLAGSKNDGLLNSGMKDFAKRGYVTASIDYRLGMFNTEKQVHCNVTQLFNAPWDCLNVTDTVEWYRAFFRAVQDGNRAIDFLLSKSELNIDKRNVFILGESAGAITALGVGFLDKQEEILSLFQKQNDALAPNLLYQDLCIRQTGYDTGIAFMNLTRPDLVADYNPASSRNYKIKGVASFYGAMFYDLFQHRNSDHDLPSLYLFHQPNDLVVSIGYKKVLQDLAACFSALGGCQDIISRPLVAGSDLLNTRYKNLIGGVQTKAELIYDRTANNGDCLFQVLNPTSGGGHTVDNYLLRTQTVATLFAKRMDESSPCTVGNESIVKEDTKLEIFPNPGNGMVQLQTNGFIHKCEVFTIEGKRVLLRNSDDLSMNKKIDISHLSPGIYLLNVLVDNKMYMKKLMVASGKL
ncbi:MAG: T9SS type A sorting domain-containing protein [Saprospiraceae bacterium]|nr:T9SS type A sorting domain-containing protein [Candidatus Vicinibacter affinis]